MGGGGSKSKEIKGVDGEEIDHFIVEYVGSVPVKAPQGTDVAKNAVERLLGLGVRKRKVELKVTTTGVFVIDSKSGDIIKTVAISDLSFVAEDPGNAKLISFFENDTSIRLITCHTFYIAKNAYLLAVAINAAFKAKSEGNTPSGSVGKAGRTRSTSKKDALKSAVKVEKKEKGECLFRFPGRYLGTVNVSAPKGKEVMEEAVDRIEKIGQKELKSSFMLHADQFCLMDAKEKDEYQLGDVREITFCQKIGEVDGGLKMAYIVNDKRLEKMTCSVVVVNAVADGHPSFRQAIDKQQKAAAAAYRAEMTKKQAEAKAKGESKPSKAPRKGEQETGKIIGTFEATYLGVVQGCPVKGQEVVEQCVKTIKAQNGLKEGVFLSVSTEGIRNIESLSHEILSSFVLKGISFTTVAGINKDHFAFIEKDEGLDIVSCHVFKCAGERAFDIATAFGDAFKAYAEEQKRTGGNPFKEIPGDAETVPTSLRLKEVDRTTITAVKAIGAGQFGQVFLANDADLKPLAVKMLRGGCSGADEAEFTKEAEIMVDLDNEHLVELCGVIMNQRPKLILLEFLPYGDLRNLLKGCEARGIVLTLQEQAHYCEQIAAGMSFVASKNLIHMDLAARNCLVGNNNHVKVADFGLTRRLATGMDHWASATVMKIPVKWCPPETLDERVFSVASDVWAFGVVMWEIVSYGAMPYQSLKTEEVQRKVRGGFRLTCPKGTSKDYVATMLMCFAPARTDRPSFDTVKSSLEGMGVGADGNTEKARDIGQVLKTKATSG